jgi:exonuclease III
MVQNNQFVIIMGDLNVSHQILDQSDVEDPKVSIKNNTLT